MIAVQSHCYSARKTRAESWRETAQRQVRKKSVCSFNFLKRIILSSFVVVLPLSCPLSSVLELERSVLETWFVPLMGHRNKEAYTSMQRMDKSIKSYLWLYLWNLILFLLNEQFLFFFKQCIKNRFISCLDSGHGRPSTFSGDTEPSPSYITIGLCYWGLLLSFHSLCHYTPLCI